MAGGLPEELLGLITELVRALPRSTVMTVADRLRVGPPSFIALRDRVLSGVGNDAARARVRTLLDFWQATSVSLGADVLAAALEGAAATFEWHRNEQKIELVWTGPAPVGTVLRRSDQALLDLIRNAQKRLLLVTFAAYRLPVLHAALVEAAARDVTIDFVLESPEESQGKITIDPLHAIGAALAAKATIWTWPLGERPKDEKGRHGTLHAKCALADGTRLFISSANLTGDAMLLNMELGVLVEGGALAGEVEAHFARLRSAGTLQQVQAPQVAAS